MALGMISSVSFWHLPDFVPLRGGMWQKSSPDVVSPEQPPLVPLSPQFIWYVEALWRRCKAAT